MKYILVILLLICSAGIISADDWRLVSGEKYGNLGTFDGYNWTGSTWQENTSIVSGFTGNESHPFVFNKDSIWYAIVGINLGTFYGYNWTGSTWQQDAVINASLGDIGGRGTPTVFEKSGTWYLISGEYHGTFNGYNWTGSEWQVDNAIISGLVDTLYRSTPCVFEKDSIWYLITGRSDGTFDGYNWTGSTWQSDSVINASLGDVGAYSSPTVFEKDSTWYLISGDDAGYFEGRNWTGAAWQTDTAIVSGLVDIGLESTPMVFDFASGTPAGTPNPTNLQSTKGTTWVNHTWDAGSGNVTDSYNVSINSTWHNTTTTAYYNNTPLSSGAWSNITVYAWNSTNSELSSGSVSEDVQTVSVPAITSYGPTGTIYPEVQDSQLFNVTVDQSTSCYWYVNGSLVETDSSNTEHAYTNTSLLGGGCNVTADVGNANGNDTQTWLFEVGADSVSYVITQDTPTNQSMIKEINVTRIGSNVTDWGIYQNHTFSGWTYYFRYSIGTEITHLTASSNNESLWFNDTSLLPIGVYFINVTSTAPVITNLTNSTPKTTSVTITWDTDISSNNRVYYGTNETEINAWINGTWSSWHNATTSISIGLSGLSANTTYYYKPESRDVAINQSVAAENFTTAESTGIETFVNPSFISTGAAAILFVAATARFVVGAWRNRRRKRRN